MVILDNGKVERLIKVKTKLIFKNSSKIVSKKIKLKNPI